EIIAGLFQEVLGLEQVSIDDSFFDLGGDSISSIRLVSRCRKAGLIISSRNVFQSQTVAALASVAAPLTPEDLTYEPRSGFVPLTPVIHWMLERHGPINIFNQSMIITVPDNVDRSSAVLALQKIFDHHDILRSRLVASPNSLGWQLEVLPPGTVNAKDVVQEIDLLSLSEDDKAPAIRKALREVQYDLDPYKGQMVRGILFKDRVIKFALVVHHLVIDGVSWRILVPDLLEAANLKSSLPLEPVRTSFLAWANHLKEEAHTSQRLQELGFWKDLLSQPDPPISPVSLNPQLDTSQTTRHLRVVLPSEFTVPLLTKVPALIHGRINDVLLTAFALSLIMWRHQQGSTDINHVLFDLESHGREEMRQSIDLSRTIGWFTSISPVRIEVDKRNLATGPLTQFTLLKLLKSVKEQLRQIPDNGIGYGLLRYMNSQTAGELAAFPNPQICFNYLGRFGDNSQSDDKQNEFGGGSDAKLASAYALELNARVKDHAGGSELVTTWSWPSRLFEQSQVNQLIDRWLDTLKALAMLAEQPLADNPPHQT
nr:condensation domain-containing protein [Agrobacterium sp. rho-8.1]